MVPELSRSLGKDCTLSSAAAPASAPQLLQDGARGHQDGDTRLEAQQGVVSSSPAV